MKLAQKLAVNYIRARLNLLAVLSVQQAARKAFQLFCTPWRRHAKELSPFFEQAEQLSTSVKGIVINGFRWNKGGSKKVLVLHGFESSCKNFEVCIQALVQKNYEVLAFDAPAHGVSGGQQITLPLYIETIMTVHFQFGIFQSFVAHSFGGLALTHFIEKIPHDPGTRLALIAPATETKTAIDSFFRFLQLNENVRKAFEKIILESFGVASTYYSIPRALENIRASILWVHDKDDEITPLRDIEPLLNNPRPDIRFMITEGLGHKKIYRNHAVVRAVAEFI